MHFPLLIKGPANNTEQISLSQGLLKCQQSPALEQDCVCKILKGYLKPLKLPIIVELGGLSPNIQNCNL